MRLGCWWGVLGPEYDRQWKHMNWVPDPTACPTGQWIRARAPPPAVILPYHQVKSDVTLDHEEYAAEKRRKRAAQKAAKQTASKAVAADAAGAAAAGSGSAASATAGHC